jgi:acyl carrier protein
MTRLVSSSEPTPEAADARDLEAELADLIVDVLVLEIKPEDIAPDAPLFRDGLGLDSIDALELALALSKRYGVAIRSDDERNTEIFASLRSLSRFILANRGA